MPLQQIIAWDKVNSSRVAHYGKIKRLRPAIWLLARTGDSWFWLTIIAILIWQQQSLGWTLLQVVLISAVAVFLFKTLFRRERPSTSRIAISSDKYAFPSGHAARAGSVAVALAFAFPQLSLMWILWAVLVSVSRVALSRHFLTDVLGGLLVGIAVSAAFEVFAFNFMA